eukprot:m.307384 g.307384  ORF g.307384 m.307384 type:complete len:270 (+) comp42222_c0_seq1:47-856(+)
MLLQDYNFAVFKEPRGFIKIIELIFVILALAVLVSFDTSGGITISSTSGLSNSTSYTKFKVRYDFDGDDYIFTDSGGNTFNLGDDKFGPSAGYYVATSSLTLMYTAAAIGCYVFVEPRLNPQKQNIYFLVAFSATCGLTLFWLIGGAVWSHATDGVPSIVDQAFVRYRSTYCPPTTTCLDDKPGYGGMIVGVVLAFLNFFIWLFDCWFVFKETTIFRSRFKKYEVSGAVKFKHKKGEQVMTGEEASGESAAPFTTAEATAAPQDEPSEG